MYIHIYVTGSKERGPGAEAGKDEERATGSRPDSNTSSSRVVV